MFGINEGKGESLGNQTTSDLNSLWREPSPENGDPIDDPGLKLPVSSGVLICENGAQSAPLVSLFDPLLYVIGS